MKTDQYEFKQMPDREYEIKKGIIYVCKEDEVIEFFCPCGCDHLIILNTLSQAKPCWSVQRNTIIPSINRIGAACKSHFNITDGKVVW